ncbi:ABC transporter ATP-binding protein [Alkaliphilus hydrothermalis]|uniref:ABC-2 type transport system ATP-binding protein n=1 Tax=Alkaliphilus hydrothermalis TaxID=1482730 RepID=A0ABS2NTX0_9FIRM|nr:ABC transporter ATP-binding protein [Alkaliphilus hydrothermalis]MBM7616403.1 ABC-2 type transport system ATP-binding protein [Alkaliphilus hydrothermalis]
MDEYIIKIQGLNKSFKDKIALKNITFNVKMGEIIGIVGHNGAGKSTLINTMVDVYKPNEGELEFIFDHKSLYDHIGVQMQKSYFEGKSKVIDICKLYKRLTQSDIDIDALLQEFELINEKNTYIKHLSGGNLQRLSILLTLVHQPEVIFLDELTTGLDPLARRKVWEVLKEINKKRNVTIILSSHFLDEIEYLADRIIILNKGEMAYFGGVSSAIDKYSSGEKIIEFQISDERASFKLMKYEAISLTDGRYQIRTNNDGKVLKELFDDVGIKNLIVKAPSLEDVFLKVAGYRLDEEGRIVNEETKCISDLSV